MAQISLFPLTERKYSGADQQITITKLTATNCICLTIKADGTEVQFFYDFDQICDLNTALSNFIDEYLADNEANALARFDSDREAEPEVVL
jgi:hypothetical protein